MVLASGVYGSEGCHTSPQQPRPAIWIARRRGGHQNQLQFPVDADRERHHPEDFPDGWKRGGLDARSPRLERAEGAFSSGLHVPTACAFELAAKILRSRIMAGRVSTRLVVVFLPDPVLPS